MGYPDLKTLLEEGNPDTADEILVLRPTLWSQVPLFVWFVISILFVYLANYYLRQPSGGLQVVLRFFSPRWFAIVPLGILGEIARRYYDRIYLFDLSKMTKIEGRLSLRYNVPSIKYVDIKGVVVQQTFWGRLLDFGDVELGTAAQEQSEMLVYAVRDPYGLADLIEQFRAYNLRLDPGPE